MNNAREDQTKNSLFTEFKTKIVRNSNIRLIIDLLLTVSFMIFAYKNVGFWLEGNDDNTIAYIVSGHLSLEPSSHVYFANVIYGWLFSVLYKISSAIPWYGMVQLMYVFLVIFIPLRAAEKRCQTFLSYLLTMIIGCITVFSAIRMYTFVQFTTISALLAIAGYVWLILSDNKRSSYIIFFILEFLAIITRSLPMLMIQPIGYACYFAKTLYEKNSDILKKNVKGIIKNFIVPLFIPLLGIVIFYGVTEICDSLAYSSEEWQIAMKFENYRTAMNDSFNAPQYEEVKHILDKYNIGKEEYDAIKTTRIFETEKYLPLCEELVEYAKKSPTRIKPPFAQCLRWLFYESYIDHPDIVILTLLCLLLVILSGNGMLYLSLFAYYAGKSFAWRYVYNSQKFVERVMNPLYYSETIFLLCMILFISCSSDNVIKGKIRKTITYILLACSFVYFSTLTIETTMNQYAACKDQNYLNGFFYDAAKGISDYCLERPESNFIVSGEVTVYLKYPLLTTVYSAKENFVVLGGWFCPSPEAQELIHSYLSDAPTYLIVSTDSNLVGETFIDYCEAHFGNESTYIEDIYTAIGDFAKVYQLTY